MNYRPDIDGLRAVAILPVVLYHAGLPGLSGGFVGVDVFFVISGFLITSIVVRELEEGRFSLISFYERRARRILPALMAVIVFCFAVGWVLLLPSEMKALGQSAFATAFFASNFYFVLTFNYFAPAAEFAPLLHTWSLAVEEQFYLFFPPLLMLLAGRTRRHLFWVVAGLSLASFALAIVLMQFRPSWAFYLIFSRMWELGAGAILALVVLRPPRARLIREALAVAGLGAICIPMVTFTAATPFPGLAALPPVIGASMLIWIGARGDGSTVNTLLAHRAFVWVGLISYSLYLWHWPILAFLRTAVDSVFLPPWLVVVAIAVSFTAAWLSYRFIERPFRAHPTGGGIRRRAIFVTSALSLSGVICLGLAMHVLDGHPGRLPERAVALAAVAQDTNPRRQECFNRSPPEGLCGLNAPTEGSSVADFLFWGDSHALAFMPGMEKAAENAQRVGFFAGRSACPPILDVRRKGSNGSCKVFNDEVWTWLQERDDIPTVILAARWAISVEGVRTPGEAGDLVDLEWVGRSSTSRTPQGNVAIVEEGLRATVDRLLATGRRVVLVGPVPEFGQNIPNLVARRFLPLALGLPEALPLEAYEARSGRTERMLERIANDFSGVSFVRLSDVFCDNELCRPTTAEGVPLYYDDDHISRTAAETLLTPKLQGIWY
ncbi:MAG: acyltransferase family protein [Parvularcula sp.]|jgi:peptidoglycan/LPS O-acetylase OafA/YrhL|nr:acyltransferase family protein [Parvularcula sp.]